MVRPLGPEPDAGAVVEPEPGPLRLLLWNLQPLAPPLDPLVVHDPAGMAQQGRNAPVAVAAVLPDQLEDVGRQPGLVLASSLHLALGGTVLAERAADPALNHAKGLAHAVVAPPAARRAQK